MNRKQIEDLVTNITKLIVQSVVDINAPYDYNKDILNVLKKKSNYSLEQEESQTS